MDFIKLVFDKLNLTMKQEEPITGAELFYSERIAKCTGLLVIGMCDIILGYIPMGDDMLRYTDSAIPYRFIHFDWYVPCGRMVSRFATFSRIFSFQVCISFLCSSVGSVILIRIEAYICLLYRRKETAVFMSVSGCSLSLWAVILGVSAPELPRTSTIRVFFLLFIWYSFVINTIFQTFFTSYLVNPGTIPRIQNFQQMLDSGIEIGFDPFLDYHFQGSSDQRFIEARKRRKVCRDRHYCFGRVDITGDFAYMDADYYADWYSTEYKNPRMCKLEDGYLLMMITSHFSKGSIYVDIFNRELYRILESGIASKVIDDHNYKLKSGRIRNIWFEKLSNDTLVDPDEKNSSNEEYVQYSLSHMQITFCFIIVGYILSFTTLLLECAQYNICQRTQ
ncbi:hypothetical protein L9F63_001296 [Diploptera punctata]|uniref:Ionotropic glutamate receptor C-terminal domain-containing protein n=1 Tax=Diploptera punctata TaxID=6984 RepID=A0AAD8EIU3_DIPPU|nr:hypothetical protein L9F63_001296 [Diploptera punctata]